MIVYNIITLKNGGDNMFEIREVSQVEATGKLFWQAASCACTWAGVALLWTAACC